MEKRSSFSGSIGFVLAAAGSAVGLGNIWRFPYLAAKDGGGRFLLIYIILALTFGFTLLMTEVSIGRKTKQSCLTAYGKLNKNWGFLGVLASIVPFIIMPYYCVIGGWVLKYSLVFITGQGAAAAGDDFFTQFITGYAQPIVYNLVFLLMTAIVIFRGVNKGIESLSKVLMPILTEGRTGLHGLSIYLIPDFSGTDARGILMTIMDAMGQLFYSISVAMGIMVTYGSYFKDKDNLIKSVNQIEIFDTIVAFLAGIMIIPAVYVFLGTEGLENAGPGLVFVAMPKIFAQMGVAGNIVGAVFFIMVLFAALTSCISIMEAICSGMIDRVQAAQRLRRTDPRHHGLSLEQRPHADSGDRYLYPGRLDLKAQDDHRRGDQERREVRQKMALYRYDQGDRADHAGHPAARFTGRVLKNDAILRDCSNQKNESCFGISRQDFLFCFE